MPSLSLFIDEELFSRKTIQLPVGTFPYNNFFKENCIHFMEGIRQTSIKTTLKTFYENFILNCLATMITLGNKLNYNSVSFPPFQLPAVKHKQLFSLSVSILWYKCNYFNHLNTKNCHKNVLMKFQQCATIKSFLYSIWNHGERKDKFFTIS